PAIHREQAQVLDLRRRGCDRRRWPALPHCHHLHPLSRCRQMGGKAPHRVHHLHRPRRPAGGLRSPSPRGRHRQRVAARRPAHPQVRAAVQGARRRRRRAHPHPQGAPRRHRREIRLDHRGALLRRRLCRHRYRHSFPGRQQAAHRDQIEEREPRRRGERDGRMNWDLLIQLLVNGFIVGMLYGVVAMGFTLIYKSTQVVNFAQGEFLVLGAWICWFFIVRWQLPFVAAFAFALVFTTLFGILVQVVILRPLVGEPIISVIMVTIGLSIFMQALLNWTFGTSAARFPNVFGSEKIEIAGLNVETAYLMSLVLSLVIMVVFFYFFRYSR